MQSLGRVATAALLALCMSAPVRAGGMFGNVVEALRFSGFVVDRNRSDVSNSSIAVAGQNFRGNTVDLGDFNLTLNGPVSAMIETGGRRIPTLDLTLSTGLLNVNPNQVATVGAAQPLSYTLAFDSGTNTTDIVGNMLFDARFSVNAFGSYDLKAQFSNRETTLVDGRFDEASGSNFDVDLGPIDIEGNLVADLLATITDPFFQASGFENVFALFSGRTFREQESESLIAGLLAKVDAGKAITEDELSAVTAMSVVASVLGDAFPDIAFLADASLPDGGGDASASAVPEPATLMLALAGAGLAFRRRRRI
jgi:PEP-CTERM motif